MTLQPDGSNTRRPNPELERILAALHSAEDEAHRAAYDALVALGGECVPDLLETFPETQGRALAARALGLIGSGERREADRAVPALIVRLADHDELSQPIALNGHSAETVSEAAAWALKQINTPDANKALEDWGGRR